MSTGALIAPFAFLGPGYDATLREVYTSGIAASLLDARTRSMRSSGRACSATPGCVNWWPNISMPISSRRSQPNTPRAGGCSSSRPIWIRSAPRSGTWGASPHSARPRRLNLFRDVVAASASLPVVFPPMLVTAEANGKRFEEMHVDGGVTAPVLTLPEAFLLHDAKPGQTGNLQLYILINNKVERNSSWFGMPPSKSRRGRHRR